MSQWNINLFSSLTGILIFFTYIDGSSLVFKYDTTDSIFYNNCTTISYMYTSGEQYVHTPINPRYRCWMTLTRSTHQTIFFVFLMQLTAGCSCRILYTARQHPNKNATAVERAFSSYILVVYSRSYIQEDVNNTMMQQRGGLVTICSNAA